MSVTPMFPLGTVLFPHMPLDLRIFEERYLKLLGDLMMSDSPEFGVVLLERGTDADQNRKRFDVGTIAEVSDIGTTEEFYGLQSVGSKRFSVNSWLPDDPYPIADIDFIPELIWDDQLAPLRDTAEHGVRKLLAKATEFTDLQYGPETLVSDEPIEAIWQLAGMLPIGSLDQLDLLRSDTAQELLMGISKVVRQSDEALDEMIRNSKDF